MKMNVTELKRLQREYSEFAKDPRTSCEPSAGQIKTALEFAVKEIERLKDYEFRYKSVSK